MTKKVLGLTGIGACLALAACTSMGSIEQMHDTRMRMQNGKLSSANATNYGTMARGNESMVAPIGGNNTSSPARANTTMTTAKPVPATAGNTATVTMHDAPANPQPQATSGNSTAAPMSTGWHVGDNK